MWIARGRPCSQCFKSCCRPKNFTQPNMLQVSVLLPHNLPEARFRSSRQLGKWRTCEEMAGIHKKRIGHSGKRRRVNLCSVDVFPHSWTESATVPATGHHEPRDRVKLKWKKEALTELFEHIFICYSSLRWWQLDTIHTAEQGQQQSDHLLMDTTTTAACRRPLLPEILPEHHYLHPATFQVPLQWPPSTSVSSPDGATRLCPRQRTFVLDDCPPLLGDTHGQQQTECW